MKKIIVAVFCALLLCSCAPKFNYMALQTAMTSGNCPGSLDLLKNSEAAYGKKAKLLHLLDSGMIHFQCDDPKTASRFFLEADELAQNLWTKSLSKEAASYVTNDLVIPYNGEDFERAMISLFSAFSYIKLGEYEEAMADCRRLDTLLSEYNSKYDTKNVYKEDALGRYISGVLSEMDKEYSEAFIYYYEAHKAFQSYATNYGTVTPQCLYEDLLRVATPADRKSEALSIVPNARGVRYINHQAARKMGRVVFLHMNGKGPVKIENKFTVNTPSGPISIAFPNYITSPPSCRQSRLILKSDAGTIVQDAVLFEDINGIAVKDLADRKVRITAKAIARAVAKQAIVHASSKEVEKQYGAMAGLAAKIAGNIAASALEKADTRGWRTLPGEIYLARAIVPAGNYQVVVEDCYGKQTTLDSLTVTPGDCKFVFHDTVY
ncbi:hypothetical protein JCM14469_06890 [Desulfatiferula olefinivorans]